MLSDRDGRPESLLSSTARMSYCNVCQSLSAPGTLQLTVVAPHRSVLVEGGGRLWQLVECDARLPLTVSLRGGDLALRSLLASTSGLLQYRPLLTLFDILLILLILLLLLLLLPVALL